MSDNKNKKLFVRNLPFSCDDEQLKSMFEEAGTVTRANIVKDHDTGRSRGFGFVEMESHEEAKEAITKVNGRNLSGRELDVSFAKDRDRSPARSNR